jgi:competence protein ComEC
MSEPGEPIHDVSPAAVATAVDTNSDPLGHVSPGGHDNPAPAGEGPANPVAVESDPQSQASSQPGYHPLMIVVTAVSVGIATDRQCAVSVWLWWLLAAAGIAVWLFLWRSSRVRAAGIVLLAALAACGGAWHHCRWHLFPSDDLGFAARSEQQPVCLQATALSGPRREPAPPPNPFRAIPMEDRTRIEVELTAVRDGSLWRTASGRARLMITGELGGVRGGDRLLVYCRFNAPSPAMNPGEPDFAAYARADRKRSLLHTEHPASVSVLGPAAWLSPARWLDAVQIAGDRVLWRHLNPHRAGLASAVLLGIREEVTAAENEAFVETGIVHILSLSGMHVALLAATLFLCVRSLPIPRFAAAAVVIASTVFYTLLTGAQPPAVRAMVLVLIVSIGWALGRRGAAFNSLAAAGLVVLALNPCDLFRVGTQLSFLCVAGFSWFGSHAAFKKSQPDPLERLIRENQSRLVRAVRSGATRLWEMTLLGAAIWILAAPLVMARFHLLSPAALVLNTLLWLPMIAALGSGFGLLVFGSVFPPLAAGLGWICDRSLGALQWTVEAARNCPGNHFWVPGPADWWLLGFYGALGLWAAIPRARPPRRWCVALLALWSAIGFIPSGFRGPAGLECTFIAVDHGCATLLELPSGARILYDAGRLLSPEESTRSIASVLWSKGVTHLDAVVLSHADADHFNGLPGLLDRFSVGVVYVSPVMFDDPSAALTALAESIRRARVPLRTICAGDHLRGGPDCAIEVIHPPRKGVPGGDNPNSIVLAIEYLKRRILLTGDLEGIGLHDVLAEEPWHCNVLMAPHHGSRQSDPQRLAAWSTPEWLVVSGGHRIDLEPTRLAYQAVGSRIMHTGKDGAVRVTIDRGALRVDGFLPQ